jgi:ribulose-phosphate 3-epimerase
MLDDRGIDGVEIQVDGGIKAFNAAKIAEAGATALVAGSAVFNDKASVANNVKELRKALEGVNRQSQPGTINYLA